MDRSRRLQSARAWLENYIGRNVASGYRKHFGVDWVCAFKELELLGVRIDPGFKSRILRSAEGDIAARRRRKARREETYEELPDQDEHYAYIAGYTAWGFAYGVTWEEWERLNQEDLIDPDGEETYEELPDQDENYAYIAGYTAAGIAYGVTWEELERLNQEDLMDQDGNTNTTGNDESLEIPF